MNMQALLKQAQKMQKELSKVENELNQKEYESTMGGGVIKVTVKGNMEVESISINEELLEKENKEDLEEMLKSAVNDALEKAVKDKETTMNKITGGVKMPGGF
ncbi:YbaB/EbfC family nucleoid-associated protein [Erysipelotrichaceae bacterium HCN-30851]